jgi:hypothetical protein
MTDLNVALSDISERERLLLYRSVAHCTAQELPEWAQFHNHVTDLDAARLVHAIERGAVVVEQGAAWTDTTGALRARMPHLTRIVNECLRLRLVRRAGQQIAPDVYRTRLQTADVHLEAGVNKPQCHAGNTHVRFRLTDDPALIDCKACLDLDR